MRMNSGRRFGVAATVLAAAALIAAVGYWYRSGRLPKRFAVVVEGRLYRSGAVTPEQLARLQREYGVRRVVCLLDSAAPVTRAEQAAAARLGIEWHNVPLRGDGASTAEDRQRIIELLADVSGGPTLVHCAAGANRTGLAVGMYRLRCEGWTLERVLEEMRAFGFEDEPDHENLRQALAAEAAAATGPARAPP